MKGLTAAIFVLACAAAGTLVLHTGTAGGAAPARPVWSEIAWPFPMDQWGKGKAFACKAADCGADVTVYIRAKIGFCNCTTGVADDEELDRISDFDLFESKLNALGPGKPIAIAWMKGRSRGFAIPANPRSARSALSIGFNDHCDAIIATALVGVEHPERVEQTVLDFLNSQTVLRWAEKTLGL